MYLDCQITPKKHAFYIKGVFLLLVLILGYLSGMAWWQYGILLGLFIVIFYIEYVRQIPLFAMSVKDVDDVWYLGVYDDDEREIWQGYLNDVQFINIFGGVIKLTFYIHIPTEMTYTAWVFKSSVDNQTFARLRALAKFGGAV